MFKISLKKSVSAILSFFITISFLICFPSKVKADELLQLDTVYNVTFDDFERIFDDRFCVFEYVPDESGYYLLEDNVGLYVVKGEGDSFVFFDDNESETIPFNLPQVINGNGSESLDRTILYLDAGEHYYLIRYDSFSEAFGQICLRQVTDYFIAWPENKTVYVEKDSTFTCGIEYFSTVQYDDLSINWYDSNEDLISKDETSITLNSNDYVDFDDPNCEFEEVYDNLSCRVDFTFDDEDYSLYLNFEIVPHDCYWADSQYSSCEIHYRKDNKYSARVSFNVNAGSSKDCDISYQWYEIDCYKQNTGIVDKDELYTLLDGQTTDTLWLSGYLDDPYILYGENSCTIIKRFCCIVTFCYGNETVEKEVNYSVYYDSSCHFINIDENSYVNFGDECSFPENGRIMIDDLPDGVEYRLMWYKLNSAPLENSHEYSYSNFDSGINNALSTDWVVIGNGSNPDIDTSDLQIINEDGVDVSYIACVYAPYYNGCLCDGDRSFDYGYQVFKLVSAASRSFSDSVWVETAHTDKGWYYYNQPSLSESNQYPLLQYFEVDAGCYKDVDYSVSYQWYKIDTYKELEGITDKSELYIPLVGEIDKKFYAFHDSEEPYIYVDGDIFCIYKEFVCVVTFDDGNETVQKELKYKINYHTGILFNGNNNLIVRPGDDITFEVDDRFITYDLPEGITYKYYWVNMTSLTVRGKHDTHACSTSSVWNNFDSNFGEYVILSDSDKITIDSSELVWMDEDGERVSYVACVSEPYYNGSPCYGYSTSYGYEVFRVLEDNNLITITKQPTSISGLAGNTVTFSVEAEGDGLQYKWQYYYNGKWNTAAAKTSTYPVTIKNSLDGMRVRCIVTDQYGTTVTSNEAVLNVKQPAKITKQPADYTGLVGKVATYSVEAEGEGLQYKWQYFYNGKWNTASAKTAEYTLSIKNSLNGMKVRCIVTDQYGTTVTSEDAVLNVKQPAKITSQPTDCKGLVGSTVKFSIGAEGDGLQYKWQYYYNGKWNTAAAKTSAYVVTVKNSLNGMKVRCIVTDQYGTTVTSNEAVLNVKQPAKITKQPADYTGLVGKVATYSVEAEGEGLQYKWQYFYNGKWNTASAKTAEYTLSIKNSLNGMKVRCIVTDEFGTSVTSEEAVLNVKQPAKITKQPEDRKGLIGSTVTFSVEAEGDGLQYKWQYYYNGKWNTAAAKTSAYAVTVKNSLNGMKVRCIVSDQYGIIVTSTEAVLTVKQPAKITGQPADCTVQAGKVATYSVEAEGEGLQYKWQYYYNGKWNTAASKTSTYTVNARASLNGMKVRCIVTDEFGTTVVSQEAVLHVN